MNDLTVLSGFGLFGLPFSIFLWTDPVKPLECPEKIGFGLKTALQRDLFYGIIAVGQQFRCALKPDAQQISNGRNTESRTKMPEQ